MKHRYIIPITLVLFLGCFGIASAAPTSTNVQNIRITTLPNATCLGTDGSGLAIDNTGNCGSGSGGGSSTVNHGTLPIVVSALVSGNQTTTCPTCIATNTGNWSGTVQGKTLGTISTFASTDYLPSSTVVNTPSTTIPTIFVSTFNTRSGAVSLSSGDVTTALGFTPYNSTNPSNYLTTALLTLDGLTTSSVSFATSTQAGTWNITVSNGNKITWTIPPAGDQYFAPSTTIPTSFVASVANTSTPGGIAFSGTTGANITGVLSSLAITQFTGILASANGGTGTTTALGSAAFHPSTDFLPSSTVVNTPSSTIYGPGAYMAVSSSNITVSSTVVSSSVTFNIYSATTTAPFNLAKIYTSNQKSIASVSCSEYAAATTTVQLFYATSTANTSGQTVLSSIACGIAGTSTTSFTTSTIPAGDYLLASVTGVAGTPSWTSLNIAATVQ